MKTQPARSRGRRALLGGATTVLVGLALAGGPGVGGCSAPFDPPSLVNTLRILAITAAYATPAPTEEVPDPEPDPGYGPFAKPGQIVHFEMELVDGRDLDNFVPVTTVWLGGCFNPPGQQYYGCYEQFGPLFEGLQGDFSGNCTPDSFICVGTGDVPFDLAIPEDIVSSQPDPDYGPKYGIAYIFFMSCAGEIRPVSQEGDTVAGSFPLGCFDSEGRELGPDAFVPGYTQIYVFEDERPNPNPPVDGLVFDGQLREPDEVLEATVCPVTLEERRKSGCAATDEFTECGSIDVDIAVPDDIADEDPESKDANGNILHEVVWVSYFATGGTFDTEVKLVNDATTGIIEDRAVQWVPPEEPGTYQIWAVTRDNRGGSSVVTHFVTVTE
ncbi:MAG: hypothetical protein HOW73_31130 [Polyangiaceae bacterium]|nr:hypothetical protein [Polyangiaceae bacterium]